MGSLRGHGFTKRAPDKHCRQNSYGGTTIQGLRRQKRALSNIHMARCTQTEKEKNSHNKASCHEKQRNKNVTDQSAKCLFYYK